ncbi:MAG: hypothetical protein GF353_22445 [Candidatus Lokiarchaeota archaeon]|nr:hypothetical protein [Candidatus Lokiarchaeota archaeon]
MQYKVPQDVQREDTIIGPLTLKQLIILGVGGGIAYGIYVSLAKAYFIEIWLPPVGIIAALTLAFAFLKIHNLPFYMFLMNFIEHHMLPKKRFWIQRSAEPFISSFQKKKEKPKKEKPETKKQKPKSIKELTKVLDTHGETTKKEKTGEKTETKKLSKEEKREELQKIINQNYKK